MTRRARTNEHAATCSCWRCATDRFRAEGDIVRAEDVIARGRKSTPLDPAVLYVGDNGRIHCGGIRCAGHTAHATGRGLNGEPCDPIGAAEIRAWAVHVKEPMACETCGRYAEIDPTTGAVAVKEPS